MQFFWSGGTGTPVQTGLNEQAILLLNYCTFFSIFTLFMIWLRYIVPPRSKRLIFIRICMNTKQGVSDCTGQLSVLSAG